MRIDAQLHREELVKAAARIFTVKGYDAPLEHVLEEAGLGRGTLYRHFRNRSALVAAVLRHELDRMSHFVNEQCETPTLLRDVLTRFATSSQGMSGAVQMMAETGDLELLGPLKAEASIVYDQVVANAGRFGLVRPGFNAADLRLIQRMIIAAVNKDITDDGFDGTTTESAVDIVMRGIRPV